MTVEYILFYLFLCIFVNVKRKIKKEPFTARKVSKYGVFSGPYFPTLALNTEIYSLNLRIRHAYGKIPTRKNSVYWSLSCSDQYETAEKYMRGAIKYLTAISQYYDVKSSAFNWRQIKEWIRKSNLQSFWLACQVKTSFVGEGYWQICICYKD